MLRCTPEKRKSMLFRGGLATRREGTHHGSRRKQVAQRWGGEQKGRQAPQKKEKASYSEVGGRAEGKAGTAEAGESKLFSGESPPQGEGMHRGRRKKQVAQWWGGEQKGRHAPRKSGKASYSVVQGSAPSKVTPPHIRKRPLTQGSAPLAAPRRQDAAGNRVVDYVNKAGSSYNPISRANF